MVVVQVKVAAQLMVRAVNVVIVRVVVVQVKAVTVLLSGLGSVVVVLVQLLHAHQQNLVLQPKVLASKLQLQVLQTVVHLAEAVAVGQVLQVHLVAREVNLLKLARTV